MSKAAATLTIRNVPLRVVRSLKSIAKRRHRSMEQEVRALLEEYVGERSAVVRQIEASWESQSRRPSATEVEKWISAGRP
jgi:plasmid stability protein